MELDALQGTLSKVESKSSKAAKDCSTVESQLKDTQVQFGHAQFTHTLLSRKVISPACSNMVNIQRCFTSVADKN